MGKWTAQDIPDQTGRTVVVTGANSGLGFHTSLELARRGARVLMACRNLDKGREAEQRLRREVPSADVEVRRLDLADLASVREFAAGVEALDLLVNNAGVMAIPRSETADGFEAQLGTNHLGHFALTGLLLETLLAGTDPRVVTVSSNAHKLGKIDFDDLQRERSYNRWTRTARPSSPTCSSPSSCSAARRTPTARCRASARTRATPPRTCSRAARTRSTASS
jgi:NAD(P)-dependent dehydrogenase (short-subunit alcohol dehydrogenase family)